MSSKIDQIVDVANELDYELINARQQAKFFRSELKNVNRALRLRVLEYKELKRKYDELMKVSEQAISGAYQDGYTQGFRDALATYGPTLRRPVEIIEADRPE